MSNLSELQNFYKAQKVRNPWAVARAIVDQKGGEVNPLWEEETEAADTEEKKRSLMGKIVAGLEQNPWNKSMDDSTEFFDDLSEETVQKLSPGAMGALAGWWLGGTIRDDYERQTAPTASQQREF